MSTKLQVEISRLEDRALGWVANNFDLFNPLAHNSPKRAAYVVKATAELAMLSGLAKTSRQTKRRDVYAKLAQRVWLEIFRQDSVQDFLLTRPAELPALTLYASLCQCGFKDPHYRKRLLAMLRSGYLGSAERVPTNLIEFYHSLRLARIPGGPNVAANYRRSLLGKHPPLYPLTNDDVYTITHALFFTTDFARKRPAYFSNADYRYFRSALPRLTAYYLRRQNWDLTAELLITLRAAALTSTPEFIYGWRLLVRAQNDDGSFDGPVDESRPTPEPHGEGQWNAFRDNYHTTLAVLLALVTAHPGRS
jgi:hypothetical protein